MKWEVKDLPTAFKSFKAHAKCMFNGPLHSKDEEIKCSYKMMWAGEKVDKFTLRGNYQQQRKQYLKVHYEKFESYYKPKSNTIYSSFMFKSRVQKEGETFEHFVTDLKLFINDCNYNAGITGEMIRDHIDYDPLKYVKSSTMKGRHLRYKKAMNIGRTYALRQAQIKQMDKPAVHATGLKARKLAAK